MEKYQGDVLLLSGNDDNKYDHTYHLNMSTEFFPLLPFFYSYDDNVLYVCMIKYAICLQYIL